MVNLPRKKQGSRLETTARGGELDGSVGNSSNDYKNSVGDLSFYRRLKNGVLGLCMLVGVGSMSGCGALYGIDPVVTAVVDSSPSFMAPLGARKKIEMEREERLREIEIEREERLRERNFSSTQMPENVYQRDGGLYPIPGYEWVDDNPKNYRVKKIGN